MSLEVVDHVQHLGHMPAQQRIERRRAAVVRDCHALSVGALVEHAGHDVRRRHQARAALGQPFAAHQCQQLLEGFDAQAGTDNEDEIEGQQARKGPEFTRRIEGPDLRERRDHGKAQ